MFIKNNKYIVYFLSENRGDQKLSHEVFHNLTTSDKYHKFLRNNLFFIKIYTETYKVVPYFMFTYREHALKRAAYISLCAADIIISI